ncbi:MAG: class C sortase [Ruminococcus sp.]|nr:class C sortase [Ruminococcus sp.]
MNKNKKYVILSIVSLIVGIAVLFYPATNNVIFVTQQNKIINSYNEQIKELEETEIEQLKVDAESYNQKLSDAALTEKDLSAVSGNPPYSELLSLTNEQMGYIVIPKISLNQPIYHSTSDEVLERGIGHMENTSLPIGGESTHCVLSGHSGIPGMMLFTDLEDMQIGEKFYIKTLDDTLAYQIDQIKVVLPNDTSDIQIVQGEDYVTLLTCTPYGVNTHRLLVRGTRVDYNGEIDETKEEEVAEHSTSDEINTTEKNSKFSFKFILYYVIIPSIISAILITIFVILLKRKLRKIKKLQEEKCE